MTERTFEQNLAELEQIVNRLEQGDVSLEDSLQQFQRGMSLSKQLQDTLTQAETTFTKMVNDNGQEEPFSEEL
ncbi:exodeoxyribonuclease VII small subunit [Ligilactobacillus equi]|uniref:Exodeoxyribonuclease 7 small subunit n=1 Tax=Ligilactobacillus equi DSM 15833 = JCM 10991 TaxID=1423740 RepID=A0A0R1TVD0_9LACO|nr:exodeoxyribonuclease VII small subunit [Ligilactobacillus equi]KRL85196.1 hypothetical protein FC36_GL000566 [Ligilactobacillus equi DSM 15833 = JCM 10991]